MVMVADPVRLWQAGRDVSDRPVHLVAPVQAQSAKGFPLLAGLAERFRHSLHTGSVALTARSAPQPTDNEASTQRQAAAIKSFGGVLIDEHLTDLQYAALVGSAHVVVVPYALDYFRTRTSGVVLDAIAAGKPVVTTRGTWAGDLVEHHRVGMTFEDGDLDSFEFAVRRVIGDLDSLTRTAEKARSKIIADFSPGRLVSFLAGLAAADNPPPNPLQIAGLRRCAEIGVVGHWLDRVRRDDERLEQLIRQDDLERSYDNAHDYIAVLKIDAEHRQRAINRLKRAITTTSSTTPSASAIREAAPTTTQAVPPDISNAIYVARRRCTPRRNIARVSPVGAGGQARCHDRRRRPPRLLVPTVSPRRAGRFTPSNRTRGTQRSLPTHMASTAESGSTIGRCRT